MGVGAESASGSHPSHMATVNSSHSMGDHKNSTSKSKSSQQEIPAKKSKKVSSSDTIFTDLLVWRDHMQSVINHSVTNLANV